MKHPRNLALVILLGSCLLRLTPLGAQSPPLPNPLERPLPQPARPLPVNETRCDVVTEDHVTQHHPVDDGTTPDGIHHYHYVTDAEQEVKFIRCTVVQRDVLVFSTMIPLPQPSTEQERSVAMKRFFDVFFKKGLAGLQKEYHNQATSSLSATSKQP